MTIEVVLWIATIAYAGFTCFLLTNWIKTKYFYPTTVSVYEFITIIVPVRNEEENILALLKGISEQTYPKHRFEVIVADDSSTDNTSTIVKNYAANASISIRLIKVIDGNGKKKAIETAISKSEGTLIVTVDGDCLVKANWISTINAYYQNYKPKMICGGVTFWGEHNFFEKMQTIEFASLTGSGAACLKAGFPNMCNGANLAYEKQTFFEVGGFTGNETIASGDDEFLMHKMANIYPGKVHFLKSSETVVYTKPRKSINEFISQRRRWASKWKHYQFRSIKLLALFIFFYNSLLILTFAMSITGVYSWNAWFIPVVFKMLTEYVFLRIVLFYFGKRINLFIFMVTALVYPFYVVIFGLISRRESYQWKGRDIKNN